MCEYLCSLKVTSVHLHYSLSMYLLDEFAYLSYSLLLESQCMCFNINC